MALHPRQVGSGGGLQHQGHLRGDGEGRAKGPPGAHLLLGGEGEGHVQGQVLLQQLEHHCAAHPVVDGPGLEQTAAKRLRFAHKGPVIPQLHQFFGGFLILCPDVDIEGLRLGDLLPLLSGGQVDGFQADDSGDLALSNQDRLADGHPAVHPAHKVEFEKAVLGDPGDNHPHLVHMGAEHQLISRGLLARFEDNQIAQGIRPNPAGQRRGPILNILPHLVLISRDAVETAQLL